MTCVAGMINKRRIWMAGDSAGTHDGTLQQTVVSEAKIFQTHDGEMVIGFCGSFRAGQLLHYQLKLPPREEGVEPDQYMASTFVDCVRVTLAEGGFSRHGTLDESELLVGYAGRLFNVQHDFSIIESAHGYDAIGLGASVALGALYATNKKRPKDRLTVALEAAAALNASVRPPFHIAYLPF